MGLNGTVHPPPHWTRVGTSLGPMTHAPGPGPVPQPPVAKPKVMPILHLVGGGLKALGLLLFLITFYQLADAVGSMFGGSSGGEGAEALFVIAMLSLIAGVICSNIARWMDSEAQRRALRL